MPGSVTVLLFSLVATWNNYFLPLIMLNSAEKFPLTVGLALWQSTAAGGSGSQALFSTVITGSCSRSSRWWSPSSSSSATGSPAWLPAASRPDPLRKDGTVVPPRKQVLFGAAYYHEYQPSPRLDTDLDLMAEAGFSVIRVGESVWTTWEPEDGQFDLEWLAPVLDGAHQRGIAVVLGTPTYAAPPWLARRYPEIAAETATGQRMPWGGRQEIDYTHPAFKFYAERVIRKILARYADHPAVIGYQVDNEPGMLLFHNNGVFQRFVDELRHTYGDRGGAQRGVGAGLLVPQAQHLGGSVDPGRQLAAPVRPGLAEVPGQADHRVHRLAGRHRSRVRPR